jgi:hypothetical protein
LQIVSVSEKQPLPEKPSGIAIYNAGGSGLTDPVAVSIVPPKLPPGVRANSGAATQLSLRIVVNEDGTVGSVRVPNWPEDDKRIVVPAIKAVSDWKYQPGLKDGSPVKVSIPVTVVFER